MWSLGFLFSIISLRFVIRGLVGDDIFGFNTPARGYVNIPNLVYNSLDVGRPYTVFFYSYTFRDQDDVGVCCNIVVVEGCNTLTVEQIVRIFGVNRANCDASPKVVTFL